MGNAIFRRRGDTDAIKLTITNEAGVAQDINGKAFVLTCSTEEDPIDATAELFQLVGTVTDADAGEVEFPMTDEQADHVGRFFFDVEMTDGAVMTRRTVLKGPFVMDQDITKSDVETIILLDSFGVDDSEIVADGLDSPWVTEFIISTNDPDDSRLIAGTRDGRRVVRWVHPIGFTKLDTVANLHLFGDAAPLVAFNPYLRNIEIILLGYIDGGRISLQLRRGQNTWIEGGVTQNQGGVGSSVLVASWIAMPKMTYPSYQMINSTAIPTDTAGWYWLKARFEKGLTSVKVRGWKYGEAEPESWTVSLVPDVIPSMNWSILVSGTLRDPPLDGTEISEIAQISYRTWI
jgi:hypothetical protein